MVFCSNCKTQAAYGVKFCPNCGAPMEFQSNQQPGQVPGYPPPFVPGLSPLVDRDVQENKAMAILAYIIFFIPLIAGVHKTSPFAKFHTNQGTVLFIASVIWGVAYTIATTILVFVPIIGIILIFVIGLIVFVFFAFCILGIVNAANGVMKPLPLIGGFTIIR